MPQDSCLSTFSCTVPIYPKKHLDAKDWIRASYVHWWLNYFHTLVTVLLLSGYWSRSSQQNNSRESKPPDQLNLCEYGKSDKS